ncbi:MAG: cytochrome c oxidase subunit 3 family protein [Acidobacteria bacterium]|nr:cytochrome c oxidase subunit 3 family protein [Acidobacteriota bacterium]
MSQTLESAHGHHPAQQHHFATMEQQFSAAKLGMWLFLATEILLFGGLFVGYGIMHNRHPEAFVAGHHHLQRPMGAINTIVLLFSSFTMVVAVWASQTNRKKLLIWGLIATIACAGIFMVVKYFEYSHKIHDGLLPGKFYSYKGPQVEGEFMFFSFYFMMTGLHGFHVLIGMIVLAWILIRAMRNEFSDQYYAPVDLAGLYWHLVDLIWIYLFPLLYLVS